MKRLCLCLGLLSSLVSCKEVIKGEGAEVENVFAVSTSAESLLVSDKFEVFLTPEVKPGEIKFYSNANLVPFIQINDQKNKLEIQLQEDQRYKDVILKVYISSRQYHQIEGRKDAQFHVEGNLGFDQVQVTLHKSSEFSGVIDCEVLQIELDGSSEAQIESEADQITAQVSGSSELELRGLAKELDLEISTASEYKGYEMLLDDAQIDISGVSEVEIYAENEIVGIVSEASVLYYKGNPKTISIKNEGGSTVEQK